MINVLPTTYNFLAAAVLAAGGLGIAAAALVDATKAFWGGVSNIGFHHIERAVAPFRSALRDVEADWLSVMRARWINGEPESDQKMAARQLIRLGMLPRDVDQFSKTGDVAALAKAAHLDAASLKELIVALATGATLRDDQTKLSNRLDGAVDAAIAGGFALADQQYRNASKVLAGLTAILLSVCGSILITTTGIHPSPYVASDLGEAVLFGLVAVPLAPIAKDLASALQGAASGMKLAKS